MSVGGQAVVSALFQLGFILVFPFHHWEHLIVNITEADVLWNIFLPLKMSCSTISDAWTGGWGRQYLLQAAWIHVWGTPGFPLAICLVNNNDWNRNKIKLGRCFSSLDWLLLLYPCSQLCSVTSQQLKTIWSSPCVHTKTSSTKHQWITLFRAGILSIATVLALVAYVGFKASFVRRLAWY